MNLTGVSYYSSQAPFLDRAKTADKWQFTDAKGWRDYTGALNADGYPIDPIPAGASIGGPLGVDDPKLPPPDRYVLTWKGTARIGGILAGRIVSSGANRAVFEATAASVVPMWTGGTLTERHLVRADQEELLNKGETFNPAFLARATDWPLLRFMDWEGTNGLLPLTWTNRPTERSASWAASVPIEVMVKLANQAHADMWFNVPTQADDTYVRSALTLIRDTLDPGLKVHVEYTNEPWNWGFPAPHYLRAKAADVWGNDANHDGTKNFDDRAETLEGGHMVYYGYRSAQIAKIAHDVLGARAMPVLGSQTVWADLTTYYTLNGVTRAKVGTARDLFAEYAVTTYFGWGANTPQDKATLVGWARGGEAGMAAAFHELEYGGTMSSDQSLAAQRQFYAAQGAIAKANGMKLVAYEGGLHAVATIFPDGPDQNDFLSLIMRMQADPRMPALLLKMAADFAAAGGTEVTYFNDVGAWTKFGSWGLTDNVYQGSARYDALKKIAR